MSQRVKLAPSILNADFARLGQQVAEAERAGADRIHEDVMDGHFVPNLSMGAAVVHSLRAVTQLPLEIHLMVMDPDSLLDRFAEAGSDSFLVHAEGNHNLHRTVQRIRAPVPDLDQVLVMTVNPGFGHEQFLHTTLPKIGRVRALGERTHAECEVEVPRLRVAGAHVKEELRNQQIASQDYAYAHGIDKPEFDEWTWPWA